MGQIFDSSLIPILTLLLQGLWAWALYTLKSHFVSKKELKEKEKSNDERFTKVENDIGDLNNRVELMENSIKNLPSEKSLTNLSLEMESVRGDLKGFGEKLNSTTDAIRQTNSQVGLIYQYLLDGKK